MAKRKQNETDISLLNTNSAKAELEQEEKLFSKKQKLQIIAVVAAVAVFVVALVVVGGIVSKNMEKKEQLRQPDESMSAFYAEETQAAIEEGKIESIITQAYYTNEKGLHVSLNFGNGFKEAQQITKIFITVRDKNEQGKVIAEGNTDKISKKTIVPAGKNLDFELYLPPEFVKVDNHSLENIYYSITLEYLPTK